MIFSRTDRISRILAALARARIILPLSALCCLPASGKENPVELFRRHRYEASIAAWEADAGAGQDEKSLRALKGKSMACFRLGSLYANLQKFSHALMAEYYGSLAAEAGASPLYSLYLGQIQYQEGSYDRAKASLQTVKKSKAAPAAQEMADVFLLAVARSQGDSSGAGRTFKDDAAVWQNLDINRAGPNSSAGAASSLRGRRCKLRLMLRDASPASLAEIEKALRTLLKDVQQPEMYLDKDKNTQINFYDPFLLPTLSEAYFTLGKLTDLSIREEEKKFPALAAKFNTNRSLADACLRLGQAKEAAGFLGDDASLEGQLLRARILAGQNKWTEASAVLESSAKSAKNPEAMKDIADCYYLLGKDLEAGLKLAGRALKDRDGSTFHRTYASLLFAAGKSEAAVQEFAKGYKIEYRNRIDQIDPEYMGDYAFAIFRTNKLRYEEIVETLYHLQKEFPPCRQMHYCMQGISAGLARSYESQRIFRKGG